MWRPTSVDIIIKWRSSWLAECCNRRWEMICIEKWKACRVQSWLSRFMFTLKLFHSFWRKAFDCKTRHKVLEATKALQKRFVTFQFSRLADEKLSRLVSASGSCHPTIDKRKWIFFVPRCGKFVSKLIYDENYCFCQLCRFCFPNCQAGRETC